jgi:hypothetical protein
LEISLVGTTTEHADQSNQRQEGKPAVPLAFEADRARDTIQAESTQWKPNQSCGENARVVCFQFRRVT